MPDRPGLVAQILRRLASVRAQATLVAVVVVSGAMALGAVALVSVLRSSMTEGVEQTAQAQVNDIVSLLALGRLPAVLPSGREGTLTQVVSPDGRVLASSSLLSSTHPVSLLQPSEEGFVMRYVPTVAVTATGTGADRDSTDSDDGPYLLLGRTAQVGPLSGSDPDPADPSIVASNERVTVYVAGSLRPVDEATGTVGTALAMGVPVLVFLVGILVWLLGGRALKPVEAIRAEVADISDHRDLHRRVPEPTTGDEVALLAQTMNGMLDRLESAAALQRRFVADASHELRSPLTVVEANLEVALAHPEDVAWTDAATAALEESRRLHRLVEDLLVLARADERRAPVDEPVDLDELILAEARKWRATGQSVALDLHRVSGGRVYGRAEEFARVVHNLMDNAFRHATARVRVSLTTGAEDVTLVVEDDGPGIPEAERDRVFERFTRLDEARSQDAGGSGLGLAIVRQLVSAAGGQVVIEDARPGARLVVVLPAADPAVHGLDSDEDFDGV